MGKRFVDLISVSLISHGHGLMVERLVNTLLNCSEVAQILITRNVPECLSLPTDNRIIIIDNVLPKGFGANHNAAFKYCNQPFFCPLNPDIELTNNPFPQLLSSLEMSSVALVAPLIRAEDGSLEDSIRRFPTPFTLIRKLLTGSDGRYLLKENDPRFCPEWVAGMFMLFRSQAFSHLSGFDERFYLYYEDVDICVRTWQSGMKVMACPDVSVIHHARRDSHRRFRYLRWHIASANRYFLKHWMRLPSVVETP